MQNDISEELKLIYPRLWRYCLVLTGNRYDADDLAQSAGMRALERSHQFRGGAGLDRWVFRIAQTVWINELRSAAVRRGGGLVSIDETDLPDIKSDPETNLIARQLLLKIMQLPEAQKSTVFLVYVEGYSYKQAADILDIPIGTIMSRLAAARRKLVEQMSSLPEVYTKRKTT